MAELTHQERLQPTLLDRLTDDNPLAKKDDRERRVMSKAQFRQSVLRDLGWLFNATRMTSSPEVAAMPELQRSVINFGLPPLSGSTASSLDAITLERTIKQAIIDFEPRILPDSLQVRAIVSDMELDHHNVVTIEIRGSLWGQPLPIELLLRTQLDLETGEVEIRDMGA